MRLRLVLIAVVALLLPLRSFSVPDRTEHILDFHSDITLEPDGTFLVRETITVNATGAQIRHGTISCRLGPRNFPANLAQPARRHRPAPVTRLPFIPVRTGMVLPRQDFPAVLPAALPALSLPLRPLPDPRMVRAAAPAAVVWRWGRRLVISQPTTSRCDTPASGSHSRSPRSSPAYSRHRS